MQRGRRRRRSSEFRRGDEPEVAESEASTGCDVGCERRGTDRERRWMRAATLRDVRRRVVRAYPAAAESRSDEAGADPRTGYERRTERGSDGRERRQTRETDPPRPCRDRDHTAHTSPADSRRSGARLHPPRPQRHRSPASVPSSLTRAARLYTTVCPSRPPRADRSAPLDPPAFRPSGRPVPGALSDGSRAPRSARGCRSSPRTGSRYGHRT